MKKKLIAFSLILCMVANLFIGCAFLKDFIPLGNESDTDTESNTTTETNTQTQTNTNTQTSIGTTTQTDKNTDTGTNTDTDTDVGGADTPSVPEEPNEPDAPVEPEEPNEPDAPIEPNDPNQKQNWNDDGVLKILAIGNSFSDDAMEYVYQVAKDAGVQKVKLGNMFIGGCTLATHLSNAKNNRGAYDFRTNTSGTWSTKGGTSIKTAVESDNWDFITFQQASGYSGIADTYDDLNELISIVEPLAPSARFAWHMTWAYKTGSGHADFPKYNRDQMTMYNAIVGAVNDKILTNDKIEIVIPSGTSIQNVRTSFIGDMTRDGYHLSTGLGRYIASMTYVKALTGLSIDNSLTRPNDVDSYELKAMIEGVNNALLKPYEVTNSSYPKKDAGEGENDSDNAGVIPEGYVQLTAEQMGLVESSFYNTGSNGSTALNSGTNGWYGGFMATKRFTREELPVGTIIEIAEGWQYRPEGWNYTGTRPGNVTMLRIIIDEDWWGSYTERGFNISQIGHTTSSNMVITLSTDEVAQTIFKIIVPADAVGENE